ncbi:MAG: hypothetical protein DSM107014_06525 [Gomphosphaeria aponina SAG 52.96 = DSM 107014]|uniref:Uncharacterized protein n=1 Tax=Gomphosphaeria aponina SAG 52.96 = DSM 107014 TaxID=1521640 RepID=A0A941GSZ2_9CHRO|nr:hypothetical protein [Gomphosphaeria aponina SAG 52.96 = DSM 107014]
MSCPYFKKIITEQEKLPKDEQQAILEGEKIEQKQGCLDDVINLVDEWLAEDSEYDQEVYPQLKVALANHPISIAALNADLAAGLSFKELRKQSKGW